MKTSKKEGQPTIREIVKEFAIEYSKKEQIKKTRIILIMLSLAIPFLLGIIFMGLFILSKATTLVAMAFSFIISAYIVKRFFITSNKKIFINLLKISSIGYLFIFLYSLYLSYIWVWFHEAEIIQETGAPFIFNYEYISTMFLGVMGTTLYQGTIFTILGLCLLYELFYFYILRVSNTR